MSTLLTDLPADGPHPDLADDLTDFGRFIGTWDMAVRFYDDAGTASTSPSTVAPPGGYARR